VCVCICVCARVRVCARVFATTGICVFMCFFSVYVRACVLLFVERLPLCASWLCGPSLGTAATRGIHSSARDGRACVVAFGAIGRSRALAAGATWNNRTTSAPWAARYGHTTVIDIAGAIYVIGGFGSTGSFNDVWVSTDRGADRATSEGGGSGGT
jgi:hypothetical protein